MLDKIVRSPIAKAPGNCPNKCGGNYESVLNSLAFSVDCDCGRKLIHFCFKSSDLNFDCLRRVLSRLFAFQPLNVGLDIR